MGQKCAYCGIYNRCLKCNGYICERCGADLTPKDEKKELDKKQSWIPED